MAYPGVNALVQFAPGNDTVTTMDATVPMNEISSCQMLLNFDILAYVGHWIKERKDLLSFISTCSDLYRTGIPILLGFHYRITSKNLAAFHEFLVSQSPSSFLGLRSLELWFSRLSAKRLCSDEISMIADILHRAEKIQNIEIFGNVMESDPMVYRALGALQALESLDLYLCKDPSPLVISALAQLRSPIVSLRVRFHNVNEDIFAVLSNLRYTLQQLLLADIVLHDSAPNNFCYSKLTHLHLMSASNLRLSILIPAFPNLDELVIRYTDDFPDELDPLRTENLRFQREHPDQTWSLSSLTGDVASLHVVALQTAVRNVIVTCVRIRGRDEAAGLLRAILIPLRPLWLSLDRLNDQVFEMDWLSNEVAHEHCQLVRLGLELTFAHERDIDEHKEQLNTLFEQLAFISVSKPPLAILCIALPAEWIFLRSKPDDVDPAIAFANSLDMRSLATRALLAVPTLRMVKFTTWSKSIHDECYSYWTYEEDGELVEVEDHVTAQNDLDEKTKLLIDAYDRRSKQPD